MSMAIWTDFGGVLTPPVAESVAGFCRDTRLQPAVFQEAMRAVARRHGVSDPMAPLDTPLIDQVTWEQQMAAAVKARTGDIVDLSDFPRRWFADRPVNDTWIAQLRAWRRDGRFIGLLSNMPPAWDAHWRRMVAPDGLFDDVVLSFQVACRKPEPAMFALAARRAGLDPAQCVLVDDLPANCAGAVAAGWRSVCFTDARSASAAIADLDAQTTGAPSAPRPSEARS